MDKLTLILKSARLTHWVKNIVIFAPIVFSGFLLDWNQVQRVGWAFILFCLLSSSIYIFNDLIDIEIDKIHPFKKKRPIASGKLDIMSAVLAFIVLSGSSLFLSFATSSFFFSAALAYYLLNIFYSLWWKKVPILDVFSIAIGFILRVYAGAFVINVHMDVWFLLTVVSASLFLAVGKRRSEMTILEQAGVEVKKHRETLLHYTPSLLDGYTSMFATTTWLTYALYSFLHPTFSPEGRVLRLFTMLPRTLIAEKWLMITVPVVIYGVMKYMQLIYESTKGETPHKVLFSDKNLMAAVGLWGAMVITLIYFI